jgi:hypothetical protein
MIEKYAGRHDYANASVGHVKFETTGYRGGDSGHGGRLVIRIKDDANMLFDVKVTKHRYSNLTESVTITFLGDDEMNAAYSFFQYLEQALAPLFGGEHG